MKYMGSKRAMLTNGIGHLIDKEISRARRFVDLFAGSAAVTRHAACRHDISVLAFDLQHYSKALASAVVDRDKPLNADLIWGLGINARKQNFSSLPEFRNSTQSPPTSLQRLGLGQPSRQASSRELTAGITSAPYRQCGLIVI